MAEPYELNELEEGDARVSIEKNGEKVNHIFVKTSVNSTYGLHIRDVIDAELTKYNVNGLNVYVYDNGGLEYMHENSLSEELVKQGIIVK